MTRQASSVDDVAAFWDAHARRASSDAVEDLSLIGTVTTAAAAVRLRDRLEKAHLLRIVRIAPDLRVLDLGGGAGRMALWLAPRVREVVLVDGSETMLQIARERAKRLAATNVSFVRTSVLDFEPCGQFDLVLVFNVAAHLSEDEIDDLACVNVRALRAGGAVVLKEPVTADRTRRTIVLEDPKFPATIVWRPRESYAESFGKYFSLEYQAPTCAHLIPWFARSAEAVVSASEGAIAGAALAAAAPLLVRADPLLQRVETVLRSSPLLSKLVAPVEVLQDFYVFRLARAS